MEMDKTEDVAVTRFREYVRINTSQPNPDYDGARRFYETYARELDLTFSSVQLTANRTVEVLTWRGTDPSLQSVMLYCHTDVVPSFPENWIYPPHSAHKDEHGNIYGRGTQDMKCVGIQYLEAIRELKSQGTKLQRTFHVVFGPDEEIGGEQGMKIFVKTEEFHRLNVGFALDEGLASNEEHFRVFYAERNLLWLEVKCHGNPGHGSSFIKNTAAEKLQAIINRFLDHRREQEQRLSSDPTLTAGDVTSINLTIVKGGVQFNVVPGEFTAGFDIRIPPTVDLKDFEDMLEKWRLEAGSDVTYNVIHQTKSSKDHMTATDDRNPWWVKFNRACQQAGIMIKKEIFPAGTDGRKLRMLGLPVLGFSPMNHTPVLLHDHNEYLNETVFLKGVLIYRYILTELGSL